MQRTTLSFTNIHEHGALFTNILKARKQSFIVQNRWDLPETEGMEFDQYDTPQSRWLAVHEGNHVLGGLRLAPTTARCGIYSYMIRDAQRGLLKSIPEDLLHGEAPVDPLIWEATRLFVASDVPVIRRALVHNALVNEMFVTARAHGASRILALVSTLWTRWTKRFGLEVEAIGPALHFDNDVFQCISIKLQDKMH